MGHVVGLASSGVEGSPHDHVLIVEAVPGHPWCPETAVGPANDHPFTTHARAIPLHGAAVNPVRVPDACSAPIVHPDDR